MTENQRVCYACGGRIVHVTGDVKVRFRDRTVVVPDVAHEACEACGERLFSLDEAEQLQRSAAEVVRAEQSLLTGEAIKSWRTERSLTQEDLEHLLGVGAKTVTRWERGLVFQSSTADRLLRVAMRFPSVFRALQSGDLYREVPLTVHSRSGLLTGACIDNHALFSQSFAATEPARSESVVRNQGVENDAIAAAA